MADRIFRLDSANRLTEMIRADFASEDVFQTILADHPAILGGEDGSSPLLIKREQAVSDSINGGGRWSLDHLYVDTNGVPILVEVKRATDTRIRREVVAQMLDYAANGVAYWPLSQIVDAFTATCALRGEHPEEVLSRFLPSGVEVDSFWRSVEANLRSGRIRMLFVADEIPRELRRIVEFLNEQMRPAEVLAVQVEHYLAPDGARTLVPRLIGATERAVAGKAVGSQSSAQTTDEWLSQMAAARGDEALQGARRVIDWFGRDGHEFLPTNSGDALSLRIAAADGKPIWPFFIRSTGQMETALQWLKGRPAFASDTSRADILSRLRAVFGAKLKSTDKLTGWPSFPVASLLSDTTWQGFTEFALWLIAEAKRTQATLSVA